MDRILPFSLALRARLMSMFGSCTGIVVKWSTRERVGVGGALMC